MSNYINNKLTLYLLISSLWIPPPWLLANTTLVPPPPPIEATAYLLQDFDSGQILMEKQIHERFEPASLTKLMTAYIVFTKLRAGHIHLTDMVKVSEQAWRMSGSRMYIELGKSIPLELLLKGMIIQSGNDATVALAEHVAGSEDLFVSMMNQQAQRFGFKNTFYTNSTGWPDVKQYSSPYDLTQIARAIIQDFPEYYHWYSEKEFAYNNITQPNRNLLLWRDQTVDGMKTGFTEIAGYCLVASAKRGNMRLMAILLGATSNKTRASESQKILDYGFRFFETHQLYAANQAIKQERVRQGNMDYLPVGLNSPLYVTVPKGQYEQLIVTIQTERRMMAPVAKDKIVGTLKISLGEEVISERPVISLMAVEKGNFLKIWTDQLLWFFKKEK